MAGGARPGGLEPAQMLIAAAQLSIFDLKFGKSKTMRRSSTPENARRNFRRLGLTPPYGRVLAQLLPRNSVPFWRTSGSLGSMPRRLERSGRIVVCPPG